MLFSSLAKKIPVRALVLGLNGTPYSLVQKFLAEGRMQVVDVLPTLYGKLGMEPPQNIDGRSFLV